MPANVLVIHSKAEAEQLSGTADVDEENTSNES